MFHQKVVDIRYSISYESREIENFNSEESFIVQKIGEFVYETDNIYLATNVRKLWNYIQLNLKKPKILIFENCVNILRKLSKEGLLIINFLDEVIYSPMIISPKLMLLYYKNFLQNFQEVLKLIIFEIEEKKQDDSFKIAQNIKIKLVVVNNILDYLNQEKIIELMRYSGTPIAGGKSFIILKINQEKLDSFKDNFLRIE